jgi:hypothetical protein
MLQATKTTNLQTFFSAHLPQPQPWSLLSGCQRHSGAIQTRSREIRGRFGGRFGGASGALFSTPSLTRKLTTHFQESFYTLLARVAIAKTLFSRPPELTTDHGPQTTDH